MNHPVISISSAAGILIPTYHRRVRAWEMKSEGSGNDTAMAFSLRHANNIMRETQVEVDAGGGLNYTKGRMIKGSVRHSFSRRQAAAIAGLGNEVQTVISMHVSVSSQITSWPCCYD